MSQKVKILILNLLCLIFPVIIFATPVNIETAIKAVNTRIALTGKGNEFSIKNIIPIGETNIIYFYAAELNPVGYMIIAADDDLPPVIAYSFQDNIDNEGKLFDILKHDISGRLTNIKITPEKAIKSRKKQWDDLINGTEKASVVFQQWPPSGTTSTGGWLETNWTQSAPYNQMCPIDPVTSSRSYAGCPATAMAQIINYHRTTNNTLFDDGDDYYHNYSGRTFWIDNDYTLHGFPSFPQLNIYLDTLNSHYQYGITLNNQDMATLTFACGVAATQVYTSQGSGTFGVSQALDAYQKFNCNTATLLLNNDTSLYTHLAQNMKDSLPAHLALVDSAWSTGHNVVVDGYNTDNFFHVNFGWGGPSNGWYLLPDQMPYSLTVVEGLIVDIMKNVTASIVEIKNNSHINIFPNPAHSYLTISTDDYRQLSDYTINIKNVLGQTVFHTSSNLPQVNIDVRDIRSSGLYFVTIKDKAGNVKTTNKIIFQ